MVTTARTLSVSTVARLLKISGRTVYRLLESGELEGYKIHQRGWWRVTTESVDALLARLRERHGLRSQKL